MQLQLLLLSLAPALVSSWTLTWYSDSKCTEVLGHIDSATSSLTHGDFDDDVKSLVAEMKAQYMTLSAGPMLAMPEPGDCTGVLHESGSTTTWSYQE